MDARRTRTVAAGNAGDVLTPAAVPAVLLLLAALTMAQLIPVTATAAGSARDPRQAHVVADAHLAQSAAATAGRDSLLMEIRRYRAMIRVLSDSLSREGDGELTAEQRIVIERNIGDVTRMVEGIGAQLGKLEFAVKDNRISLVDDAGDGIIISIPENLDERVSQGIEALTAAILKELPDSLSTPGRHHTLADFLPVPRPPKPPRHVIDGNVVRIGHAVAVGPNEDVRGNVVVVFGDCEVAGRVDGNVVTVGGALSLLDEADVRGSVVAVGGKMDAAPGAKTGDTVALDWLDGGLSRGHGVGGLLGRRGLTFALAQGMFLVTLLASLLAVAVVPVARREAVLARLQADPARVFGAGALLGLTAPAALLVLTALLVITVIGVPVAMLLALAVSAVTVLAVAVTGILVGRRLFGRPAAGAASRSDALAVTLGLCVLHSVAFLASLLNLIGAPQPAVIAVFVLAVAVKAVALACGLGALVVTRLGTRSSAS